MRLIRAEWEQLSAMPLRPRHYIRPKALVPLARHGVS